MASDGFYLDLNKLCQYRSSFERTLYWSPLNHKILYFTLGLRGDGEGTVPQNLIGGPQFIETW